MEDVLLESIHFENYRILKNATLPINRCTLVIGPNGSGKSSILRALELARVGSSFSSRDISSGASRGAVIKVDFTFSVGNEKKTINFSSGLSSHEPHIPPNPTEFDMSPWFRRIRKYALQAPAISRPAALNPNTELGPDGSNLAVVLTQLQDKYPERFEGLNSELARWLPEFDRILFDTPSRGARGFFLRIAASKVSIHAEDLSDGTLFVLCICTLAYMPHPPTLICFEEPDHGIHPRLLRQVHDAMVRLSNPEQFGDSREPVQVIATTHSPYFLDLFRDHPEDVVLAEKTVDGASFHRLADMPNYKEIMDDAPLGDAWYTGILGGVPATP